MKPWTVLDTSYLLRTRWLNLRKEHLRLPTGAEIESYYVLEYPDWACVLCLSEEGRVVLVEQYRRGIDRVTLELPAGAIEPGEDPLEGARRELLEETGYASDDWIALGRYAPNPGRHTNYAHLFVARNARRTAPPDLDESEDLCLRLVEADDLLRLAETDGIGHGMHVLAILMASQRGLLPVRPEPQPAHQQFRPGAA